MVTGGVAAAGLFTGCSAEEAEKWDGERTSGSVPDAGRREAAERARLAATSGALRGQYDAVLARHPSLAERLAPLRAAVAEQVTALAGTGAVVPPSPSASSSSPSVPAAVPADPGAALKALAAAERRTSDAHTASLSDAEPELARLLASVAAAGAAHAYLLAKGDTR